MPADSAVQHCVVEETLAQDIPVVADYLSLKTTLSKGRIKHALNCGALRVKKRKGGWQRLRRATAPLAAGSMVSFHYDENLLSIKPLPAELLEDVGEYSIWFKPPGLLSQGTEWGDHCSLLRQVELHFQHKRQVFVVHRLDRDACGLMLVAHTGTLADKLSQLFASRSLEKQYRVRVSGILEADNLKIDSALDGKPAVTHVRVVSRDADSTLLDVSIETGRKHQIRRHLSAIGHPVKGDPLYGERDADGLHLAAVRLRFQCPIRGRQAEPFIAMEKIQIYWH